MVVQLLDDLGVDIEVKSDAGWAPLVVAAGAGCIAVAQLLVDLGADIEAKSSTYVRTPLHQQWPDSCSVPIGTPYHLAISHGKTAVVQLLVDLGTNF